MMWERSGRPSGREDQLNKLIDVRARDDRQPWFPPDCSLKELEQLLTLRTSSRLVYRANVLEVTGPDPARSCASKGVRLSPVLPQERNGARSEERRVGEE